MERITIFYNFVVNHGPYTGFTSFKFYYYCSSIIKRPVEIIIIILYTIWFAFNFFSTMMISINISLRYSRLGNRGSFASGFFGDSGIKYQTYYTICIDDAGCPHVFEHINVCLEEINTNYNKILSKIYLLFYNISDIV